MGMTIRIRHVPRALHRRLRKRAALEGLSLSAFLLKEAERVAGRPTADEIRARLAGLPRVKTPQPVEEMIRRDRDLA
jgi:hypothetical protein